MPFDCGRTLYWSFVRSDVPSSIEETIGKNYRDSLFQHRQANGGAAEQHFDGVLSDPMLRQRLDLPVRSPSREVSSRQVRGAEMIFGPNIRP